MIFVAYGLYLLLTGWAFLRSRDAASWSGRLAEWYLTALLMVSLPLAVTVISSVLLVQHRVAAWAILGLYVLGAVMLLVGLFLKVAPLSRWRLPLRVVGWSLIAGVTLVPSTIALFAPAAGALAFLVPEAYRPASDASDRNAVPAKPMTAGSR